LTNTIDRLDALRTAAPKAVVTINPLRQVGNEIKVLTATFSPKKYKTLELLMITDVQWGHQAVKEDRVIEFRDWVLDQPNRFVFFGGDMIDAETPLSKFIEAERSNKYAPSEQVLRFVEVMMPLRHRVLGYVGGNHEDRTAKGFGPAGEMIATLMGIPYSRGKQYIGINYGDHAPYRVALWHGTGAAATKGSKAQMLHRFMQTGDHQLYLVGHLHDVVLLFDWKERFKADGDVRLQKIAGVMSSSFLDHFGTYAERKGLPPTDTMMARAILEPNGKWEVTLR